MADADKLRALYRRTEIIRRPTYGIVSGYHELPYVCLAPGESGGALEVRGKIHVSPRLIIRPEHLDSKYEDLFEDVDEALVGRVFGFLGFRGRPFECKSDDLSVQHLDKSVSQAVEETVDYMLRMEDITTGVIAAPDARYYPVSLERFIATILDDEFSA